MLIYFGKFAKKPERKSGGEQCNCIFISLVIPMIAVLSLLCCQPYANLLVDDFETDDLTTSGWVIETYSGDSPSTQNHWPLIGPLANSHQAYSGIHCLEIYTSIGCDTSYNNTPVSMYRDVIVPQEATYLVLFQDSCTDDTNHGTTRIYVADNNMNYVFDSDWIIPIKKYTLTPWQELKIPIQDQRGKTVRIWLGLRDEADSSTGAFFIIDNIHFEL